MKVILAILATFTISSSVLAQDVKFNADTQELVVKFNKKPSTTKQGRLLQALLNNSEYIQLKDGTVISIKELEKRISGDAEGGGSLENFGKELERVSGGEGTGTGSGG